MSRLKSLKDLIHQRLTAVVEEIFGHFERTIAEYEEEMDLRHRDLIGVVLTPLVKPRTEADVQQLLVVKEVQTEQQEWSSSLDQQDPEPPHIKEEQEEVRTSQEGEQLQGLEAADTNKFPFAPVSEDDDEECQYSQLHHRQSEQMETAADREDCGGPEQTRKSDSERPCQPHTHDETEDTSDSESDDSDDDWKVCQSVLNSLNNDEGPLSNERCNTDKNLVCSDCGKRFGNKTNLKVHMIIHTREKPFSCTACSKTFSKKSKLIRHMKCHAGSGRFSCPFCKKRYRYKHGLCRHMRCHIGEKLSTSCVTDTNIGQ